MISAEEITLQKLVEDKRVTSKQDMIGLTYGRLLVLGVGAKKNGRDKLLKCECKCGQISYVQAYHLKTGNITSCGCYKIELLKEKMTTHGKSKTSEYSIWSDIKRRCLSKKNISYKNYGGRGIKVCDRWLSSFENFLEDMGERPSPEHQIDRIDNNGDYEPNNCRWVTPSENCLNNSRSKYWYIEGVKYESLLSASKAHKVSLGTIKNWCEGFKSRGKLYPPKLNCFSEFKRGY